jgi:hypothetical protein
MTSNVPSFVLTFLGALVALLAAVGVAGAAWRSRRKAPLTA